MFRTLFSICFLLVFITILQVAYAAIATHLHMMSVGVDWRIVALRVGYFVGLVVSFVISFKIFIGKQK